MLKSYNIHKSYNAVPVLTDVSIELNKGTVTALIGSSGAGKSTLLRILAYLEPPDTGTLILDNDQAIYPLDINSTILQPWPKITAVFQQLFLWPHLTLRKNILLPLELKKNPSANIIVNDLIEQFEMAGFIDRYPNEVSGGQKQRVALARALALKPDYLLLDEITSALDVEQAAEIVKHLKNLKNDGMTILLITHYLGFVRRIADKVVFLENGRICESGSCEILNNPQTPALMRFMKAFSELEAI